MTFKCNYCKGDINDWVMGSKIIPLNKSLTYEIHICMDCFGEIRGYLEKRNVK